MEMNGALVFVSEPIVGVSLDSVVQKATDLAYVLRTCKHNLECEQSNHPYPGGRGTVGHYVSGPENDSIQPAPLQHQTSPTPSSNAALLEQWHHLTSYIVSLEKEVQYYKQMVAEYQQAQALYTLHPTEHAQIMDEATEGKYQSDLDVTNLQAREDDGHGGKGYGGVVNEEEGSYVGALFGHVGETHKQDSRKRQVQTDLDYWDKLTESDPMSRALLLVFCHLTTHEVCAVSRVCRRWHTISKHPLLWRSVSISEIVLTPQVLLHLSQFCTSTEKFSLHGLMPSMTECGEDLSSYISRTRGCLEEAVEAILKNSSQSLVSLSFTECNLMITERILWLTSVHCPYLTSFSYCSDEFPPSSESLWSMANGCRHLKHLSLPPVLGSPNVSCFNDNCLHVIAQGWSNLLTLTIGGKTITAEGLAEVAQSCPNLCYLELIHGPDLDKQAMTLLCQDNSLSSLTTLILNFTPSTHVALKVILGHCPRLQRLDLHVTLHSYFPGQTSSGENVSAYEQIVRNLKKLEKQRRGKQIFNLHEHYNGV